jgi:hypothetical protein
LKKKQLIPVLQTGLINSLFYTGKKYDSLIRQLLHFLKTKVRLRAVVPYVRKIAKERPIDLLSGGENFSTLRASKVKQIFTWILISNTDESLTDNPNDSPEDIPQLNR